MGYDGGGVNGALRWKDLALDELLPVDKEKEEAKKAIQARKMASGAASNVNPQQAQHQPAMMPQDPSMDEEDEDDEENDENDHEENDDGTEEEESEEDD